LNDYTHIKLSNYINTQFFNGKIPNLSVHRGTTIRLRKTMYNGMILKPFYSIAEKTRLHKVYHLECTLVE